MPRDIETEDELPDPEHDIDATAEWLDRARTVIPGGTSTGSKRLESLYGEGGTGPAHYVRADGCTIWTADGAELIDCTMALGSVAIGYADAAVVESCANAIASGNVSGLASVLEVDVAERLCDVIPCAEQVRFLKSGAEAMSAAVRIARTATGRDKIIASGYFGWSDWANDVAGVPAGARADVMRVPFDDVAALEAAAQQVGNALAAIVLEPVVERLPGEAWVKRARELCDKAGAVLIFDEMKTGFRLATGGYQEFAKIEPDLAAFGKAMANGFPIAAVVGRAAIMQAAEKTWISSTLGGEAVGLAAASAVLDWHEKEQVCETLAEIGAAMRAAVGNAIAAASLSGITVDGLDPMWMLRFDDPHRETRFLELAVEQGVLLKRGAYNYAALAHDERTVHEIERAVSEACVRFREEERGR